MNVLLFLNEGSSLGIASNYDFVFATVIRNYLKGKILNHGFNFMHRFYFIVKYKKGFEIFHDPLKDQ